MEENNMPVGNESTTNKNVPTKKNNKVVTILAIIAVIIVGAVYTVVTLRGENNPFAPKQSDEDVVRSFIEAYINGDSEELRKYIDDDNMLNYMFAGVASDSSDGMAGVYKTAQNATKNITYSVKAVEGKERWGMVDVVITTRNVRYGIEYAMTAAMEELVKAGGDTYVDVCQWMKDGLELEIDDSEFTETFQVTVGCTAGDNVMDTNSNRYFFKALTGYYYDYIDLVLTDIDIEHEKTKSGYTIVSGGDEIFSFVDSIYEPYNGDFTEERADYVMEEYLKQYDNIDGLVAGCEKTDDGVITRIGVNLNLASSNTIARLGLTSGSTEGSFNNSYISVNSTVNSFKDEGANVVQDDFGRKALLEK